MKRKEMREVEIHYCDNCGKECGLPYYGFADGDGYGNCCIRQVEKRKTAIKEIKDSLFF